MYEEYRAVFGESRAKERRQNANVERGLIVMIRIIARSFCFGSLRSTTFAHDLLLRDIDDTLYITGAFFKTLG